MNAIEPKTPETSRGMQMRNAPIRVLLIGGSSLFRTGLRALLENSHGLEVAAHAADPAAGLQQTDGVAPHIVLLDVDEAPDAALRTLQHLRNRVPAAKVLILATDCDPGLSRRMMRAGVHGVVSKDSSAARLLTVIRRVHEGEPWVDGATHSQDVSDATSSPSDREVRPERARIASLTPREREVIALMARGSNNKAIAADMNISDNTVRHHLTSIFGKLGVPDRLGLVIYAFRHRLVAQQV
jgi:DNA-binding NarL/FixJ family response regulator